MLFLREKVLRDEITPEVSTWESHEHTDRERVYIKVMDEVQGMLHLTSCFVGSSDDKRPDKDIYSGFTG